MPSEWLANGLVGGAGAGSAWVDCGTAASPRRISGDDSKAELAANGRVDSAPCLWFKGIAVRPLSLGLFGPPWQGRDMVHQTEIRAFQTPIWEAYFVWTRLVRRTQGFGLA